MEKSELIKNFIDAVMKEKHEESAAAFHEIAKMKSRDIIVSQRSGLVESTVKMEQHMVALREFIEQGEGNDRILLDGSKILVDGKVVGSVSVDHNKWNSGIDFISADGKFSKEFVDMVAVYKWVAEQFIGKENA